MKFLKIILGRNAEEEEKVQVTRALGHDIRNQATIDILSVQNELKQLKDHNNKELDKLDKKLQNITYHIARATGGKDILKNVTSRPNNK